MPALSPSPPSQASLDAAWEAIARPGGWFDGAERIAIAREVRAARDCRLCAERKAALSPNAVQGAHDRADTPLSEIAVDTIHRITTDPGRLSAGWHDAAIEGGLVEEEFVELAGLASILAVTDTYAKGLGAGLRPLPDPVAGEPHRRPESGTVVERGWVPMVDPDAAEGVTKMMFEGIQARAGFVYNVLRALTAVPEAVQQFFSLVLAHYATTGEVHEGGLDRMQVELLASTTSAYNDCFY
ncbi:MAG: alkylhydroperoxidase-related (seleno)protein [Myxococcota bacterium]